MTRLLILALTVLLLSCQFLPKKEPESGLQGYDPNAPAIERAACDARGGNYTKAGLSGGLVCVETTKDGGKSCTAASQCDGLCLARSASCSPIKPLFGCHEIITENGGMASVCIE